MKTCFDVCMKCDLCRANLRGIGRTETTDRKRLLLQFKNKYCHLIPSFGRNNTEIPLYSVNYMCPHSVCYADDKCFLSADRNVYKAMWRLMVKHHLTFALKKDCPFYLEHWVFRYSSDGKTAKHKYKVVE